MAEWDRKREIPDQQILYQDRSVQNHTATLGQY